MTALKQYMRLEASGLWRERPEAPPREVVVSFGNATLTLKDLADAPLGHWALAGITAVRHEGGATVYAMGPEGGETLAIRDPAMEAAIAAVARPEFQARRRRRRLPVTLLLILALIAGIGYATVRAVRPDADLLVPPRKAAEIGDRMLIALVAENGPPCAGPAGLEALARIAERISPESPPRIRVMELGSLPVAALPGNTVLLDRDLVGRPSDAIAGWTAVALGRDPAAALLGAAGPVADLRYLATGRFSDDAIERAAKAALREPMPEEVSPALDRLAAAGYDPSAFPGATTPPEPASLPAGQERAPLRDICG
jgi:hypothetical protein